MTLRRKYEVVIAGSGPAGCATAIALARAGRHVLIVEKRCVARARTGETLAPSTKRLVAELLGGLDERTLPDWAALCHGNISCWGDPAPAQQDFDYSAYGKGLCVDRAGLDSALATKAVQLGVEFRRGCTLEVSSRDEDWSLALRSGDVVEEITAPFVVDATGRAAALGTSLGLTQTRLDPLFSFAMLFDTTAEDHDGYTRVEACDDGWWYSNRLPSAANAQRLVVLHTDRGSAAAKAVASLGGFLSLLSQTCLIQQKLTELKATPVGRVSGAPAGNATLDHIAMEGFLAVGDAAQAYDPLSSQGLDRALTSGGLAGHALTYALANSRDPRPYLARYHQNLRQHWAQYLNQHRSYYAMEARWADHPFWARRARAQTFPQPISARDAL